MTTCGNEVIDIPSAPYKDGYSFVGWYFDKDVWSEAFDANSYAGKPLEENLNIYAYYKKDSDPQPQEYTVTFYDGENVISSLTTAGNEILSIPTAPTKEDYEFIDLSDCTQLTNIGDTAFSWCKSVKEFYICASVTKLGDSVFNQIPGVVINFEINEDEIPKGFDSSWDFTYADVPLQVNWGVSKN